MVIGLVGDLNPTRYSRSSRNISAGCPPSPSRGAAPRSSRRRILCARSRLHDPSQPFYLEGYHRPSYLRPDDAVYDAITDIMSERTHLAPVPLAGARPEDRRLRRRLLRVSRQQIRSPVCFLCRADSRPHAPTRLQKAIQVEIDKLKTQDVTDDELQMFKTRTKADLMRGLASNEGLAQQLADYQTRYGDWRELFRYLDRVDKVTKADIRRVAEPGVPGQQPHHRRDPDADSSWPVRRRRPAKERE